MNFFQTYAVAIVPLLTIFISQTIKLSSDKIRGNLNWREIVSSYGGMPSSHSAVVASLVTIVGLINGLNGAEFAIALILMLIVMRDAMKFRLILGEQSQILNHLSSKLPEGERKKLPVLRARLGHTYQEVIGGSLLGASIAIVYHFFIG